MKVLIKNKIMKKPKIINDKNLKYEDIRKQIQHLADKKRMSMADLMKLWNSKNKDKITEMVKLGDTILIRFNNITIHIFTKNLFLD